MDGRFNTSKSNKHLWEKISAMMRKKGFDRSPTMCTDKWRNLLKEFKKAKHPDRGSGSVKMCYYKEIEEILRERTKKSYKSPTPPPKLDSFMHFSDKGLCFEDTSITFGPLEASGRPALNIEQGLDYDGHPLAITTASGVPPWNWRETPGNVTVSIALQAQHTTCSHPGLVLPIVKQHHSNDIRWKMFSLTS
ncbi:hypothetical protein E1A91_D01G190900v1 [Gossypium mustelinum]|uniref:Myb/SANT-like DNA-binding domain-containing protein n=1 Tax=Gossypium mustelinum TaxID=34275 RepID=A0A5D2W8P1_GOSMU|nr:hypothetical protein E1A91_D01G190900v1 [Gossypium mustelinum]